MSTLKETLRALVDNLPDDCDWRQFYYRLYVARRLTESLRDIDKGRTYTMEEVKDYLEQRAEEWRKNPNLRFSMVQSREQLVDYVFHIQDDLLDSADREDLRIKTVDFFEALKAWLDTCPGYYEAHGSPLNPDQPSWQVFADALASSIRSP